MGTDTFQIYKAIAAGGAFGAAAVLQWLLPIAKDRKLIPGNWRTNLTLAAFNAAVTGLVCGGCLCGVSQQAAQYGFGLFLVARLPPAITILVCVVALDGVAWAWHRANHRMPALWRFHAVHHSDTVYDVSTAVRFHLGEIVVALIVRGIAVLLLGAPVAAILAFEIIYSLFNFMAHGSIALPGGLDRFLSRLVVTPAYHRVHHSRNAHQQHTNFGTIFAVWDRIFKTSQPWTPPTSYSVGL